MRGRGQRSSRAAYLIAGACFVAVLLAVAAHAATPPRLSALDVKAAERGSAVFTVRLSVAPKKAVKVSFATANGTATAGKDYVAKRGAITFRPRQKSKRGAVSVLDDALGEGGEGFSLKLSKALGARIGRGTATAVIMDDDSISPPPPPPPP